MFGESGLRKAAVLVVAAALLWCQACSETAPVEPNPDMAEIYQLSDLQGQAETILEYMNGALGAQRAQFTDEEFEAAKQLVRVQYAAEELARQTLERLTAQASPPFLDETLAWLKTPNVRKVVEAKEATWSQSGVSGMKSVVDQRQKEAPSAKRMELVERYDQASDQSGVVQMTIQLSGLAVAVMFDATRPPAEQQGIAALHGSMNSQSKLISPFFKEMSTVTTLVYFNDLSEAEIEAFVTFSESPAGKWYWETTSSALLDTLKDVADNIGPAFAAALQAQPSP